MSLYYELDPAKDGDKPLLPPILTPIAVMKGLDVFSKAIAVASNSEAGTVFYSEDLDYIEVAIVLCPEVSKIKCNQMHYIMMVAAGDTIGALAPPEVAVTYTFPGFIYLNRGEAGLVKMEVGPSSDKDSIPDWMVVGIKLRLNDNIEVDEGGGYVSRTRAVESLSRHFLAWVSQWEDEGFKSVADMWNKRREAKKNIILENNKEISWIGLDENGQAIVKLDGKDIFLSPIEIPNKFGDLKLK
jgi:BirA family biotin operon repressor/biotin-[acetyl-CoA-carboxylase] ligase